MATQPPDTFLERLDRWATEQPKKEAFSFVDDSGKETTVLSYEELYAKTASIARSMRKDKASGGWGIQAKDRVLLVYPPSLDFIIAYIACLRAGVVAVPVFPPHPGKLRKDLQHFASIHKSSGAQVALTNNAYNWAKKVAGIKKSFSKSKQEWPDVQWILTDGKLPVKPGEAAGALGEDAVERTDLAFLQYTSGSTSEPKGVMISHANLGHNLSTIVAALQASQDTVVCAWLPQYHDMGLIGSYLGALYCGGSGVYMSPLSFIKNPPLWIKMCSKYKATHTQAPNFAYKLTARKFNALPSSKKPAELDLGSMQHMFNAAEPVTADSIDAFYDTFEQFGLSRNAIVPGYGLAEQTVYVCDGGSQRLTLDKNALKENKVVTLPETADESVKKHLIGCGKPRREEHGIDLRIVDIESRAELAEDQIGEVWVNSPSKAGGYFGQEDTSAEAFNAALSSSLEGKDGAEDGTTYLRTGDLGFLHNGELFICGRDKDLIIIRGGNHYPQDIEQVVESDDRVRPGCSAAFSVTVDDEEVLVVVAELRNAKDSAVQEIARDARQRVTQEHGVQVHTLVMIKPRTAEKTSSGKIARRWARKAYLAGSLNVVLKSSGGGLGRKAAAGIGAKTKTPKKKAANGGGSNKERFLDEVSNLTEIDPDDLALDVPLQEMGLDSMVIEQMRGMISGEFGVEIEVEELFDEECTLSKIIRKIDGDDDVGTPKKDGDAVVVPIDGDNSGASRAANAKKKAPSTFEVIFCFCCRGNKNGTKQ